MRIKPLKPQLQALRHTAKFLYAVSKGAPVTPDECKTFSDMCWLQVPNRHRMDKEEKAQIDARPWEIDGKESTVNITMTQERFGELIQGPLHHPMFPLQITRLVLALWAVIAATGKPGSDAFERHCKERQALDKAQAAQETIN